VNRVYAPDDLAPVADPRLVEYFGGPNDGEFRRADENGCRPGGMYVVVSGQSLSGAWRVVAKRYVPT
jgi:hypothetical protein